MDVVIADDLAIRQPADAEAGPVRALPPAAGVVELRHGTHGAAVMVRD